MYCCNDKFIYFVGTLSLRSAAVLECHQHGGDEVPRAVEQNPRDDGTVEDFFVEPA